MGKFNFLKRKIIYGLGPEYSLVDSYRIKEEKYAGETIYKPEILYKYYDINEKCIDEKSHGIWFILRRVYHIPDIEEIFENYSTFEEANRVIEIFKSKVPKKICYNHTLLDSIIHDIK